MPGFRSKTVPWDTDMQVEARFCTAEGHFTDQRLPHGTVWLSIDCHTAAHNFRRTPARFVGWLSRQHDTRGEPDNRGHLTS